MNLILTSAGLKIPSVADEVVKILPSQPREMKLAHITTAANVAPDTDYVTRDKQAMNELGFQVSNIDIAGKNETELSSELESFDIIYVQGGNGFYLLKQVWDSGFDKVISSHLDKGGWYIGVSAGTYIACPSIEMHTWKRNVDNMYGLSDLRALNLVPFLISVHYNRDKYRELLADKIPTAHYPVRILTDEQFFLVQGDSITFHGVGEEVLSSDLI